MALTPEALIALKTALHVRWTSNSCAKRITRIDRARLLGVSVVTADRILAGKGVDRASLKIAFECLEVAWTEAFYETVLTSPTTPAQIEQGGRKPLSIWTNVNNRFSRIAILISVTTVILCVALLPVALNRSKKGAKTPTVSWLDSYAVSLNSGSSEYHHGEYKAAREHIGNAVSLAKQHNDAERAATALRVAADLADQRGQFVEAKARYLDVLAVWRVAGKHESQPAILEALGDLETKTGEFADARNHLSSSLLGFQNENDRVGIAMACRSLISLESRTGNHSAAKSWFVRSLKAVDGLNKPEIEADAKARWATVLRDQGRVDDARSILCDCARFWKSRNHPRWAAYCDRLLGTVECVAGHHHAARRLLSLSLEAYRQMDDQYGVQQCAEWLATSHKSGRVDLSSRQSKSSGG